MMQYTKIAPLVAALTKKATSAPAKKFLIAIDEDPIATFVIDSPAMTLKQGYLEALDSGNTPQAAETVAIIRQLDMAGVVEV